MKTKRTQWLLLLLAALLFVGCTAEPEATAPTAPTITETAPAVTDPPATESPETQASETQTPAPETEAPVIETTAPETEPPQETVPPTEQVAEGAGIPDAHRFYLDSGYAVPLSRYCTALTEQWTEGDYFENEMSSLGAYYYDGDPLENVGFALIDLDGDGVPELIIGAIEYADVDPAVFEIWTLVEGQAVKVVEGHPRNRYDLEYHPDQDLYMIRNHASNGAANFAMYYYRLQEGALSLVEGILFDATANADSPWFYTTDEDWNPGNDTEIDSESAMAVTDGHEAQIISPDYYPFTFF